MDRHNAVVIDPEIQGGHAVLRGTRVPVFVLVKALANRATISEVSKAYGVTEKDVRSALAYAAAQSTQRRCGRGKRLGPSREGQGKGHVAHPRLTNPP